MAKKKASKGMSDQHKEALAKGRRESKAVRDYLEALDNPPSTADPEQLRAKVDDLQAKIDAEGDVVARLQLIQQRLDTEQELAAAGDQTDLDVLEAAFIDAAAGYADRKRIGWPAWRELGVPAAVLKQTGIKRTRRPNGG